MTGPLCPPPLFKKLFTVKKLKCVYSSPLRRPTSSGMSQYITQSDPGFTTGNKIIGCQITFQKGQCNFARRGSKIILTRTEKAYTLVKCISILFIFFLYHYGNDADMMIRVKAIISIPYLHTALHHFVYVFFMTVFIPDGLLIILTIRSSERTALPLITLYPLYI